MEQYTPKYVSVYHDLKSDIISGKYPVGSFLPTEGELEKIFDTSRTTIRNAISLLKNEHLVSVCQGRGTEVLAAKTANDYSYPSMGRSVSVQNVFLVSGEQATSTQPAIIDQIPAELRVASALQLELGAPVYRLQRIKYIDDIMFSYVVSYIPVSIAPGLDRHSNQLIHLYDVLRDEYDILYTSGTLSISAINAGFLESKLLNVPFGSPLLLDMRCKYHNQTPYEYTESCFRPDIMNVQAIFENTTPYSK